MLIECEKGFIKYVQFFIYINNFAKVKKSRFMFLDSNPENNAIQKVALFESMLKDKTFTFFDAEDFEIIIEHYYQVSFKDKARKALEMGLDQYPNDLTLLLIKVETLNASQRFEKSLKILLKLNKFYPNTIEVVLGIGKVYSILEIFPKAIDFFNEVHELILLDSSQNEFLQDLAYEFMQIGQNNQAIKVLKQILRTNPNDETSMMEIGVAFHEAGKFKEAVTYFKNTIDESPYNHLAWFNLATIYNIDENWKDAIFGYEMCLVINEKFTAAHYGKANSYIQLKEYQKAIDSFNESFIYDRPHAYAYCSIGECYEKIGDYSKALIFYEKSLEIDDTLPESWLGIGVVRDLNNQPHQAIKFIKKAIELDSENPEYWYLYAELLTKINKKKEAEIAFKKVIDLEPNNIDAWIDYSNFLYDNNSKSKALKEVKKGIENNKDDLDLKLRLVAMQISSGLIPDAKSSLSKMQHLDKNIFKKLIDIYPEVLKDKSMNQFFDFYNDNSSK